MKKKPTNENASQTKSEGVNGIKPPHLLIYRQDGETDEQASARAWAKPEIQAAQSIYCLQKGDIDVNAIAGELAKQIDEVNKGNMQRPEAILLAQAATLNELFNNLTKRASLQTGLVLFESMLRLAFKAQAQCTRTLEVLSSIKNPPIVYAKQANFGHNQQVNNGVALSSGAPAMHAGETKNQQNELLEVNDGERLDTGAANETIADDKAMAALD